MSDLPGDPATEPHDDNQGTTPPVSDPSEQVDYDPDTEERDDTVITTALKRSLVVFVIVAVVVGGILVFRAYLGDEEEQVTGRAPLEVPVVPERPTAEIPTLKFTDITESAGISFIHENGAYGKKLLPETMGGGCAFLDFDGDGWPDIYLPQGGDFAQRGQQTRRLDQLFRNLAGTGFENVTGQSGLVGNGFGQGATVGDFNADGFPDLYVANDYGRNCLYRNDGGRFTDVAATAGVEDIAAGMSVSWCDYNGDGRPDLYVGNMFSSAGERIAYQRRFQSEADQAVRRQFQRHARGNTLFENVGDGTFRDVSVERDVTMGRWAWGSPFADINNDGRPDLLVANGYITGEDTNDL